MGYHLLLKKMSFFRPAARRACLSARPTIFAPVRTPLSTSMTARKNLESRRMFSSTTEKGFWGSPEVIGPTFLLLLFAFPIYRGMKDVYWTQTMCNLNRAEIVSDRMDWLQRSMLQDEVAETVRSQATKYESMVIV